MHHGHFGNPLPHTLTEHGPYYGAFVILINIIFNLPMTNWNCISWRCESSNHVLNIMLVIDACTSMDRINEIPFSTWKCEWPILSKKKMNYSLEKKIIISELAHGQKCMQDYRQLQASVIFNQYLNNNTIS